MEWHITNGSRQKILEVQLAPKLLLWLEESLILILIRAGRCLQYIASLGMRNGQLLAYTFKTLTAQCSNAAFTGSWARSIEKQQWSTEFKRDLIALKCLNNPIIVVFEDPWHLKVVTKRDVAWVGCDCALHATLELDSSQWPFLYCGLLRSLYFYASKITD